MRTFHVVSLPDNSQAVYEDYQVTDGFINFRVFEEDGDNYHYEKIPVEIDRTFIVDIVAKFIMSHKDDTPMYSRKGLSAFSVNHFAYNYSILIIEYFGDNTLYESSIRYSKAGIGTTDFGMYSYHRFDENNNLVYDDSILEHEVLKHLNLGEILIKR